MIRELVLEPSTVKDDAKKVVEEFADLVAIHSQLVDARAQKMHLSKLPELSSIIEKTTREFEELTAEKIVFRFTLGKSSRNCGAKKLPILSLNLKRYSLKLSKLKSKKQMRISWLREGMRNTFSLVGIK
ncbi:hypothetical protein [Photorhabdus akhurstii]|uniref:hypothetical protein n=1 Tax=Photorhabdus akhurstii TaxID=171438 RepID=UPI002022E36B|nr:hypothetical protein [Photorhabdus akhurstii]